MILATWKLRKGAEKRFRTGHPWVFSNELTASPKGVEPGQTIKLTTENGNFLAYGYGNPKSLIAFRALSYYENTPPSVELFSTILNKAHALRASQGLLNTSHRLLFAENDYAPGLIIDKYVRSDANIYVVQSSTAGMDALEPLWREALEKYAGENSIIIYAHTSNSRVLEGIKPEPKRIVRDLDNKSFDLKKCEVLIQSAQPGGDPIPFTVDLIEGQKTGFFLDQRENIKSLIRTLKLSGPLRVLDLCCYVGQWGTQIANFAKMNGTKAEVHLFDTSESALALASTNVARAGGDPAPIRGDVVKGLHHLPDQSFDIVICDPPAFIKKKKDIPTGQAAYQKLFQESQKKVKIGGTLVACSCSGLFTIEDFKRTLARASFAQDHRVQWIHQGFHSPDHPQRLEFPEGTYLKSMIGIKTTNS